MSTDKADIKLNPAVEEMSSKIREAISVTITGKGGDVANAENIYESLLPADIPADLVKRINTHNEMFMAAAVDAVGDTSRDSASQNADLTVVNASFNMTGRNKFDVQWDREVERNAGIAEKGKVAPKKTVYGAMSAKLTVAGTDSGTGEMNKVMRRQKQAAHDLFSTATA